MENVIQQDQDDQSVFIYDSETSQEFNHSSDCDDVISSIDEFMDTLTVGPFHYLITIACGISFGGYAAWYQSIGLILIAACDLNINATNRGWLGTCSLIGSIVGSILTGKLTDSYSRRKILLISIFINMVGTLAVAFAYNYVMLAVMAVLIGSSYAGVGNSVHPYVIEFFPRRSRGIAGACLSSFAILGSIFSSLVALAILPHSFNLHLGLIHFTNWRIYVLIVLIPTLLSFCILLFMPNSLRFVLSRQDKSQIRKVLDKINRINSCCRDHGYSKQQVYRNKLINDIDVHHNISNSRHSTNNNFISHFRKLLTPPWRKRLLLLSIIWIGYCISDQGFTIWVPTVMSYYIKGNTCRYHPHHYNDHNLSMNYMHHEHINKPHCYTGDKLNSVIMDLLIGNLLSLPGALLAILLINRVGRKVLYCVMASICGLCILLIVLIDTRLSTMISLSIFMSLTANTWIPGKVWSTELFSTEIRGTGVGMLNIIGHGGAILSTILFAALFRVNCTLTLVLFAICGLLTVVVALFLPDTTDIDIG